LEVSTLWDTLVSSGCEQEVIREDCRSPKEEKFQRIAELTTHIFTSHGLRSGPRTPTREPQESDSDKEEDDQGQGAEAQDDTGSLSDSSVDSRAASEGDWGVDWQDPGREVKEKKDRSKSGITIEEKKRV